MVTSSCSMFKNVAKEIKVVWQTASVAFVCMFAEYDQLVPHAMVTVMQHSNDMFAGGCNAHPGQHITAHSLHVKHKSQKLLLQPHACIPLHKLQRTTKALKQHHAST